MILVIGASGAVGIPLLKNLLETEQHLRVLTSNKSSEERLKSLGVKETIVGDWSVSSDLKTAMSGIKSVCYIPARFKENELEIILEGKFTTERGRINCSLRESNGSWRWLGIQFVISNL